jgi:hypothetical protein
MRNSGSDDREKNAPRDGSARSPLLGFRTDEWTRLCRADVSDALFAKEKEGQAAAPA